MENGTYIHVYTIERELILIQNGGQNHSHDSLPERPEAMGDEPTSMIIELFLVHGLHKHKSIG